MTPNPLLQLQWALEKLAHAQGTAPDSLKLQASLQLLPALDEPMAVLAVVSQRMGWGEPLVLESPDRSQLPLIAHHPQQGWCVLVDQDRLSRWVALSEQGTLALSSEHWQRCTALVPMQAGQGPLHSRQDPVHTERFETQVSQTLRQYRGALTEAVVASGFIGLLALLTSLYSMQVYDRVIPTRSESTLIVLTAGVGLSILIELAMKFARSSVMDHVIVGLDNRLSRGIFQRLLQLRVDQLPLSVGSLASQMRGYEQVRNFYTASTLFTLVDLPLGIVFLVVIMFIGTPFVALVPLLFGVLAVYLGMRTRKRVDQLAKEGAAISNMKTGLLVEAVEGVETIKAGSGGWKFLSRWLSVNGQTIHNDLKMRQITENVGYFSAGIQQISYVLMVAVGSFEVMQGHMTMGGMIGCSILSGRVLAPIMALPGLLVQHAHAKAAGEGLNKLYELKTDHHGVEQPLVPSHLRGHYTLKDVQFAYGSGNPMMPNPAALLVPKLQISAGEHVAILGPIGAGKSTLLRLLSGLYHPQQGRVMIDGLDITQISREVMSREVGYLQQDHRLFQGSLRENLLIGMTDPGDEAIIAAMNRTGMTRFVSGHPLGLSRPIAEGGKGLSGGQRQLVAFTRLILTNPDVLLLDEPTATMDDEQERACLQALAQEAQKGKTLVIVTHKPSVFPLVQRIIVVAGNRIVLDGPRDQVLESIRQHNGGAQQPQPTGK
ncbi:ATP-binding cassette domain-containing protein [Limnohabitans sp.]|uniref:ATP-binding cassette domain-containing protein n=1 Tax=Limnohabitans sp. TaxID=1907725 RepID=UPI0028985798|nr:ATP-binding cassette domain-containing protein [Limnohabitans sp.]